MKFKIIKEDLGLQGNMRMKKCKKYVKYGPFKKFHFKSGILSFFRSFFLSFSLSLSVFSALINKQHAVLSVGIVANYQLKIQRVSNNYCAPFGSL